MRSEPDPIVDPYRTLDLEPGASMAEVKRAYRLLAKAFHPDSAGEAALPRFLAIHEAYESLRTGRVVTGPRTTHPAPAEPWRADPSRARAARERSRAPRNRSTGAAGSGAFTGTPGGGSGTSGTARAPRPGGASGPSSGPAPSSGASGAGTAGAAAGAAAGAGAGPGAGGPGSATGGGRASSGSRGPGRKGGVRKATMGSTSYDDARDHGDAAWSGASWYGPTTGEYWIVNPREYADPRKHGPDYQSRARRPGGGEAPNEIGVDPATDWATDARPPDAGPDPIGTGGRATQGEAGPRAAGSARADAPAGARRTQGVSQDRESMSRRWASQASEPLRSTWDSPESEARRRDDAPFGRPGEAPPDALRVEAFGAASRAWLGGPADDPIRRLGLALIAWPPIGLAAAAVIGDVTGCSVYSAECGGAEPLLPWLAQAAILGLLLLLPPLTRLLAGGAVAVLVALVPITAFLVAVGGTGAPQAGFALATLLGVAWLVGVGWSAMAFRRRQAARVGP